MPPLPLTPPPEEAATILPKLEKGTIPYIEIEEVVVEDTTDAYDTEDIPPQINHPQL